MEATQSATKIRAELLNPLAGTGLRPHLPDDRLECLLPDRWLAEHPEALLEQRLRESRAAAIRKQRRRAARRSLVNANRTP